jgi:hypothetical protein
MYSSEGVTKISLRSSLMAFLFKVLHTSVRFDKSLFSLICLIICSVISGARLRSEVRVDVMFLSP